MCKHETNLKRNQAKCQVLVAEAGEAKSSAARFGSQMATTPEIPEIAFIIQAKRHAMNDLTSMWSRNAEVSFCFLDFIFKSLKILRSFPAIESQVNSNTVLICFNPCGKLTFVFSRLLIKTWIHPAEKWANLGCRAELFTRPQEIESCLETPRHCSGDCTHLAICTCLRRHGVYTAAEAAEASIAVFWQIAVLSNLFCQKIFGELFWPKFDAEFNEAPWPWLAFTRRHDGCPVAERSVRGCWAPLLTHILPTWSGGFWWILSISVLTSYITKVCSPWFHLFSPLFGRVEELVELLVAFGWSFGVCFQCSAFASAPALLARQRWCCTNFATAQ